MNKLLSVSVLAVAMTLCAQVPAAPTPRTPTWVTSWYASPQPVWSGDFALPTNVPAYLDNQTLSESVRLSVGGARLRLVFSNRYGKEAVLLGGVQVAPLTTSPLRLTSVTFAGQSSATVAPGAQLISDPVALAAPPLTQLVVRSYFPQRTPVASFHWGAQQTIQFAAGNWSDRPALLADGNIPGRLFLNAVMVETGAKPRSVVVLGDSITDGNGSTADRNRRWPDFLAARLASHGVAVINAGISGARLLRDAMGVNALARLDHDVFSQPGASALIVMLGTNDIGWPGSPFAPAERPVTLKELIAGYSQLIAAAQARGLRVTGCTVPPFEGALEGTPYAGHYTLAKEALRQDFNSWIRTGAAFDGVIDFDALLRDPANVRRLHPKYDSGDHLHPGDAGYRAMAQAVDLASLMQPWTRGARPALHGPVPHRD